LTSNFVPSTGTHTQEGFTLTRNFAAIYQDWQKNSPARTRTATNQTARPLYVITFSESSARLRQVRFAVTPGQFDNTLTNPFRVTNVFNIDSRKPACTSQACIVLLINLFHLDNCLTCTLPGLPLRKLAFGNSRFCLDEDTKPAHERHMQALKAP
jgi:hypothetical protein